MGDEADYLEDIAWGEEGGNEIERHELSKQKPKTKKRHALKEYLNISVVLTGEFDRYGRKKSLDDTCYWNTALLKNLRFLNGKLACDHLWFIVQKNFLRKELRLGAKVRIVGVVTLYQRGNGSEDFCIQDYKDLKVLKQGHKLVPSKTWGDNRGNAYYKFILDDGTRWYKVEKNGSVQRILYEYKDGGFDTSVLPMTKQDKDLLWESLRIRVF